MKIRKAVITAAGKTQRNLPLQTLTDRDGFEKSVLRILIEEVRSAQIDQICVIIPSGDVIPFARAADEYAATIRFIEQIDPSGYGNALFLARDFVRDEPFLHLVGDHLYLSQDGKSCAQELVEVAAAESCAVSAVHATRESALRFYGTIGGQKVYGRENLYRIETVIEKPTPTEAEQRLIVAGMRAGHYLCFFGMHVFTPALFDLLGRAVRERHSVGLSGSLAELARHEQYLAFDSQNRRYDVGTKYGLLRAQLALALNGVDREEVLAQLLEVVAQRR